ncbi:MAG: nucleotidyltransferase family protein [Solirubrobacteraceae bacterium]|nr:nucleotidyltransferase family protein [Solirubrobacteraceae bacterium]
MILRAEDSLRDAIARLRADPWGVAVVLGADGRFVSTVSDVALRRALLRQVALDAPVSEVMSARPVVAAASAGDEQIAELLRTHRVRALPVVDEAGRVVAMRALDDFPEHAVTPVAVIMAGGRGLRLRPVTDKLPKPLLRVGSCSIIERIIGGLVEAGVRDVYLAVNYKADIFHERLGDGASLGVNLHYLHEETELGTAGALSLLPPIDGPLLLTNGDIVTTVDFARMVDFHRHHGGALTVGGVEHVSHVPYGILATADYHLLSIEEKPERREFCNAGIYVLEPEVLELIAPDTHVNMPTLIDAVLSDGRAVNVFPIHEKWFDIGGPAEFERILIQFATGEES